MRTVTPRMQSILSGNQFVMANLYTLTLSNGMSYYLSDGQLDIAFGSQVYSSSGPQITGTKYDLVRGMQVSTLDLSVYVNPTDMLGGVPWSVAARAGTLKNASVDIQRAFMPAWGQPAEAVLIFSGYVNESTDVEGGVKLSVVSNAQLLNTQIPRALFQPGCRHILFDSGCGVSRSAYTVSGNVQAIQNRAIFTGSMANPDGYFTQGDILFQTGLNAGLRRSVRAYSGGIVTLSYPLLFDLEVGDAFVIAAGCDKTQGATGCAKFANLVNFNGTPYIPPPESAT